MHRPACAITLFALLCCAHPAYADTLLIQRVQQTPAQALPARGQTTGEVQAHFGTPTEKLEPRGGQRQQWPVIQRRVYPAFTVYFEKKTASLTRLPTRPARRKSGRSRQSDKARTAT